MLPSITYPRQVARRIWTSFQPMRRVVTAARFERASLLVRVVSASANEGGWFPNCPVSAGCRSRIKPAQLWVLSRFAQSFPGRCSGEWGIGATGPGLDWR